MPVKYHKHIIFRMLAVAALTGLYVSCKEEQSLPADFPEQFEAVDLGLSVKWASCNVGAEVATASGSYFAWGDTTVKKSYNWVKAGDYKWGVLNNSDSLYFGMTKYSSDKYRCDSLYTLAFVDSLVVLHNGDSVITYRQKNNSFTKVLLIPVDTVINVHYRNTLPPLCSLKGPVGYQTSCGMLTFHAADSLICTHAGDSRYTLLTEDDPATAALGAEWRTPTVDEISELLDRTKCEWTWDSVREGYIVKGIKTGKSIFLPASGYRDALKTINVGIFGYYWSSSLYEPQAKNARFFYFNDESTFADYVNRYYGLSVRAVTDR